MSTVKGIAIWLFGRFMVLLGIILLIAGLILTPLPIPLGIQFLLLATLILLNYSSSARRIYVRVKHYIKKNCPIELFRNFSTYLNICYAKKSGFVIRSI